MRDRSPKTLFLTLLCALTACCGSGPAFSAGRFHDDEAGYRVGSVSSAWTRLQVGEGNDLAWQNNGLNAIIQVNASCDPAMDVPLKALTNQLLIGFTESRFLEQKLVPMAGREALRTHLTAKLDGVQRELVLTVLKKDGCVYDFSLIAPDGESFARAVGDYDEVLAGFRSR